MKILCIEDGSVDIDKDGGIILYRHGSKPPSVLDMGSNKNELEIYKKAYKMACDNLYDIHCRIYNKEMNFEDYYIEKAREVLEN